MLDPLLASGNRFCLHAKVCQHILNILDLFVVFQEHNYFSGICTNFGISFEKEMKGVNSGCLDITHSQILGAYTDAL